MLTLKTSVAAAILAGVIAATAGVTYITTKATMQVSVDCQRAAPSEPTTLRPPLPQGAPVPLNQGKKY